MQAMATLAPPSTKQTTTTTTTGEHREPKELRKERLVLFVQLTGYSGLLTYLVWDDLVLVASVVATYVADGLLLCRRFGCWEPRTDRGRRWLDGVMLFLLLSAAVLQVSRLARTSRSSTPMLLAAVGAAALLVGGGCDYLLHRRSWAKQHRQEAIFLPLRQDPRS